MKEIQRRSALRNRYGITPEQYDGLRATQGEVCAICRNPEQGNLQVDHCHATGKIRGLLCHRCNKVLGLMWDDADRLVAAADYLRTRMERE